MDDGGPPPGDAAGWLDRAEAEIWDRRGAQTAVRAHTTPGVLLHDGAGVLSGQAALGRSVLADLHAFPDRQRLVEEALCCAAPGGAQAVARRVLSLGRHGGAGIWGPPTGRPLRFRTLSLSVVAGGRIAEIWRLRDTGAILRQIAQDPRDWAEARCRDTEAAEAPVGRASGGSLAGQGDDDPAGAALAEILSRIMEAEFSAIATAYDPACALSYPGGVEAEGHAAAERFWLPLRAAFPAAVFAIHHVIGSSAAGQAPRAALRWSLTGRHEGWGGFGRPTGAAVHVTGMTHAEFGPRGLRREWTLFDGAAVWRQILAGQA